MLKLITLVFLASQASVLKTLEDVAVKLNQLTIEEAGRHDRASGKHLEMLIQFERQLQDFIEPQLPQPSATDAECRTLSDRIKMQLQSAGIFRSESKSYDNKIEISRPQGYPEAIQVKIGVRVPYGVDEVAYLYELKQGKWSRSLALERNQNKFGEFLSKIAFSPADSNGAHLIVVVRTPVVSVGCMHGIEYQLYRVGPSVVHPKLLLDESHGADICDRGFDLRIEPDGFLIELEDGDISPGYRRTYVLHYEAIGNRVQRLAPVALQPQGFVHEWLMCEWKEASNWSAPAALRPMEQLHDKLGRPKKYPFGEYEFVQRCRDTSLWQVAVDFEDQGTYYFLIREVGQYNFEMLDVSEKRQRGCPGETPPSDKRPTLFGSRPQ